MSTLPNSADENLAGQKMLISADDYQRMGKAGIFDDKPRVELLDGEIYTMSPITPDHNGHVDKTSRFLNRVLYDYALIRTQGSIRTDEFSEPEPDITVLKFADDFYRKKQASKEDALIVIEVSVFTVKRDRTVKKKKYAKSGIPEYWIIIPQKSIIEVYKKPEDGNYSEKSTYRIEDVWKIEAFDLEVKGSDFLIP